MPSYQSSIMTRRDFVRTSAAFAFSGTLFPVGRFLQQQAPVQTEFKKLRQGIGYFTGRGGTIGWLVHPDALVVIDTQFPETAAMCLEGLGKRSGRNVDLLINSHHHGDHTAGNGVFRPKAQRILAHENVPVLQKAAAERSSRPAPQTYADTTYAKEWMGSFGDEVVKLRYWGAAHTGGDSVIHFEKANVVHTGDLVFNYVAPVIDTQGGASTENWIVVLEKMHKEFSDETIFIFGHGSAAKGITGTRGDVLAMRDYLSSLFSYVQEGVTHGKTADELAAIDKLPKFEAYSEGNLVERFRGGIRQTYSQLTKTQ